MVFNLRPPLHELVLFENRRRKGQLAITVVVGDLVGTEIGIIRVTVIVDIQDGLERIIRMGAFDYIANCTCIAST